MQAKLIDIDQSYFEEICQLEALCHLNPWSSKQIFAEFKKEISVRLGLLVDHTLIAYSFSYLVAEEFHLLNIAVKKEFQAKGYGKFLLQEIINYCKKIKVKEIILEVRESNKVAQNLYKNFGFREIAFRKNYYQNNNESALVMELYLEAALKK